MFLKNSTEQKLNRYLFPPSSEIRFELLESGQDCNDEQNPALGDIAECTEAAKWFANTDLNVINNQQYPTGCSLTRIQNDVKVHWNTHETGDATRVAYESICIKSGQCTGDTTVKVSERTV